MPGISYRRMPLTEKQELSKKILQQKGVPEQKAQFLAREVNQEKLKKRIQDLEKLGIKWQQRPSMLAVPEEYFQKWKNRLAFGKPVRPEIFNFLIGKGISSEKARELARTNMTLKSIQENLAMLTQPLDPNVFGFSRIPIDQAEALLGKPTAHLKRRILSGVLSTLREKESLRWLKEHGLKPREAKRTRKGVTLNYTHLREKAEFMLSQGITPTITYLQKHGLEAIKQDIENVRARTKRKEEITSRARRNEQKLGQLLAKKGIKPPEWVFKRSATLVLRKLAYLESKGIPTEEVFQNNLWAWINQKDAEIDVSVQKYLARGRQRLSKLPEHLNAAVIRDLRLGKTLQQISEKRKVSMEKVWRMSVELPEAFKKERQLNSQDRERMKSLKAKYAVEMKKVQEWQQGENAIQRKYAIQRVLNPNRTLLEMMRVQLSMLRSQLIVFENKKAKALIMKRIEELNVRIRKQEIKVLGILNKMSE